MHSHESLQASDSMAAPLPMHAALHAFEPQLIVVPSQLPFPTHARWHGPSPHPITRFEHEPFLSHSIEQLPLPQLMVASSHEESPWHSTTHGQSIGQVITTASQLEPLLQSIVQVPSSHPPVHSRGHAPTPGGDAAPH